MENASDRKIFQPMSPATSRRFRGYVDLLASSNGSRDISGERNTQEMVRFSFSLVSRGPFDVQRRSLQRLDVAGDIGQRIFRSNAFSIVKNVENCTRRFSDVPFSTFFTMENGMVRQFSQLMSPVASQRFRGYAYFLATSNGSRDISGKPKRMFRFPLISREPFNVQLRTLYPLKRLDVTDDIGQENFRTIPFAIVKNVENGTSKNQREKVFHNGKCVGPENFLAYVTRHLETLQRI